MSQASLTKVATTMTFEKFWGWLQRHTNCIRRAGTGDSVLFDHDEFHWNVVSDEESTFILQLARAKDLVGELIIVPAVVAYVQVEPSDEAEGEWTFECIAEAEDGRDVVYHFLLSHGYEDEDHEERWSH